MERLTVFPVFISLILQTLIFTNNFYFKKGKYLNFNMYRYFLKPINYHLTPILRWVFLFYSIQGNDET